MQVKADTILKKIKEQTLELEDALLENQTARIHEHARLLRAYSELLEEVDDTRPFKPTLPKKANVDRLQELREAVEKQASSVHPSSPSSGGENLLEF